MNQLKNRAGLLAVGTGTVAYMHHVTWRRAKVRAEHRDDAQILASEYCPPSSRTEGRAKVPASTARDGPLVLQLRQVQVLFRHGARTPMHNIPKLPEVTYDADFFIRDHQASMFPYERVSCVNGCPQNWSEYELSLLKKPLRGGALAGQLTALGKEQMYLLGLRLRDCYRQRLDIATYDPNEIRVMSSSIRRTVESAQSVMAGLYGKEQLNDYAENCAPIQMCMSDPCYNILIPNTHDCEVLRKNNHSTMIHPDNLPGFKEQRLEVEEHMNKRREKFLEAVADAQAKIDSMLRYYDNEEARPRRLEFNRHRQHYQHDQIMQPLFEERGRAIAKVDRYWANVLNREEIVREIITADDMAALVYLRHLEMEQFEGTLSSGYRIHLYFDKNPFFYNTHLCKEIFTRVNPEAPLSRQTRILWKDGKKLIREEEDEEGMHFTFDNTKEDEDIAFKIRQCAKDEEKPNTASQTAEDSRCRTLSSDSSDPMSFFQWFTQTTTEDPDPVGAAIAGEMWRDPHTVLENEPKVRERWSKKLNFVYSWDDTIARVVHGWPYPPELRKFRQRIVENAATILHYSMAGQTPAVRGVITRLAAGPLITEMLDQARAIVCGKKGLKLCLYSSHDNTMAAMLEALCIWDNKWPPFGADLRLELYCEVGGCDYYVRVLYNGKEQRIRGQTESYMHWTDFCNALRKFAIRQDEMERICRSNVLERIAQEVLRHRKCEEKKQDRDTGGHVRLLT